MYSVNARPPSGEPGQPIAELTERLRTLCGTQVSPHPIDDGSFTILCDTQANAERMQTILSDAGFRMRDKRPWFVENL